MIDTFPNDARRDSGSPRQTTNHSDAATVTGQDSPTQGHASGDVSLRQGQAAAGGGPAGGGQPRERRPGFAGENLREIAGRRRLLVLCLVLAGTAGLAFRHQHPSPPDQVAVGKPAPEIDLVELSGGDHWRPVTPPVGRVVLLHLWATWCHPCQLEYPELSAMARAVASEEADGRGRRAGQGDREQGEGGRFRFLPVSCEGGAETFAGLWHKTDAFFRSAGIDSPVFADPRGITRRSVAERLKQSDLGLPTTILIDRDGTIAGVWQGYTPHTVSGIEASVRELLAVAH